MSHGERDAIVGIKPGVTPIVVIGDDWGRHVSTQQHLFRRLLSQQPVIWVNSFGHRRPKFNLYDLSRAAQKLARMISRPTAMPKGDGGPAPAAIVNPRALPWHNIEGVQRFNAWSISRDIRRALTAVAPGQRPLFVSGTPAAFGVIGKLDELAAVYFCLDDYGEIHGVERDLIAPLETQMLARVDALVATARSLTITKRPASGRTLHLPQGVNFEHFSTPRPVPDELSRLPRPILGFAGGVGPAINFELLRAVAGAFPNASVVLVGPLQQDVTKETWPSNVHFLGPREYAGLPAYVQAFDVGLIPYVHNDWTRAVDPLKLLEYLAAGIPVVCTRLPEAFKYQDSVHLADEAEAFNAAIRESLGENSGEARTARQTVAKANRWDVRAEAFIRFANETIAARAEVSTGKQVVSQV